MECIQTSYNDGDVRIALEGSDVRALAYLEAAKIIYNKTKNTDRQTAVAALELFMTETGLVLLQCLKQLGQSLDSQKKIANGLEAELEKLKIVSQVSQKKIAPTDLLRFINNNNKTMKTLTDQTNCAKFISYCRIGRGGRFCHFQMTKLSYMFAVVQVCKKTVVRKHVTPETGVTTHKMVYFPFTPCPQEDVDQSLLPHLYDAVANDNTNNENNNDNRTISDHLKHVLHDPSRLTPYLSKQVLPNATEDEQQELRKRDALWLAAAPEYDPGQKSRALTLTFAFFGLHYKMFDFSDMVTDSFFSMTITKTISTLNGWTNNQ